MSAINRWADSSDEEDDNDEAVAILQEAPIVAPIQIMEPIKPSEVVSVPTGRFHIEDDDDDDKEREDELNDDDVESQRRLEEAKEKAKAKAELKKQHSSVSVKDQLDNLDDILNELGIEKPTPVEDNAYDEDDVQTGDDAKKRRKKKKKGSVAPKDEDSPSPKDEETTSPTDTVPVDVSAIRKAKTKKKAPSAASEAAASAAKELKAKQEGKKKKKRGDNVQFGR